MSYIVYILRSESSSRYYIGSTSDISRRIKEHNRNKVTSTKKRGPWKLVYIEEAESKSKAIKREMQIKRYKGGRAFKELIKS